jgi:hypothetical protein
VKSPNKMILLVALVCAAPFVSAWIAYFLIKPQGGKSYGELLPVTQLFSEQDRTAVGGERLKGKWILLHPNQGVCEKQCSDTLYATRQAHTMLGRERDRLVRVQMVQGMSPEIAAQHPDLLLKQGVRYVDPSFNDKLGIILIDPLGNQVIAWPKNPDIKKMHADLSRLLRASRIG